MRENFCENVTLWTHGEGGYSLFHVFGLVAAKDTVLAFAEARHGDAKDAGEAHDIVMRRSTDGGKSFAESICLFGGDRCLVNPTPIYDAQTGRILLFFAENFENARTTLYLSHSDDLGASWSTPCDVTHFVTQKTDTHFHLPGPSHGIQLQKSPYTGRLLLQLWHRGEDVTLPRAARGYCASLLYSDDHGEHWTHVPALGHAHFANESALCETDEGVFWALRSFGTEHAFTKSTDGGITWEAVHKMPLPPAFACQAGLISVPTPPNSARTVLLSRISRPEKENRRDMEICISRDGGSTFPAHFALPKGDARPGYSDLCVLDGGLTVGVLHCHEGRVLFTRIPASNFI